MEAGVSSESMEFQEILKTLRPAHLQVLLMRYHVGLGVEEIAKVLGQSYKSTESLLSRSFETKFDVAPRSNDSLPRQ